jgi:hypothetical protein
MEKNKERIKVVLHSYNAAKYIKYFKDLFGKDNVKFKYYDKETLKEDYNPTIVLLNNNVGVLSAEYRGVSNKIIKDFDFNEENDFKDNEVVNMFNKSLKIGIGRGAHLLSVKSGINLISKVENYKGVTNTCTSTLNNSSHTCRSEVNQLMNPLYGSSSKGYNILSYTSVYASNIYLNANGKQLELPYNFVEVQTLYLNNKSLCFQSDFTDTSRDNAFKNFSKVLINTYLKTYLNI